VSRRIAVGLAVACLVGGAGCTDADSEDGADLGRFAPAPALELTRSGGCADVFLWASDDDGSVVVTVAADVADRSSTGSASLVATLPDDALAVEVLHGSDLTRNLCTDVLDPAAEPAATSPATEGRVELTIDPDRGCGATDATFRIDGLVADDGSTFAPIRGTTDDVGCVAG
jgi:hypothetical protein